MGRKDKGRRYRAEAGRGAEITRQPAPGKGDYGYRLVCTACGWKSLERAGSIDLKKESGALMGRFDCEACKKPGNLSIRELRE